MWDLGCKINSKYDGFNVKIADTWRFIIAGEIYEIMVSMGKSPMNLKSFKTT